MAEYEQITKSEPILEGISQIIEAHHPELSRWGVTYKALWVHPDSDDDGNPVGQPPLKDKEAICKIIPAAVRECGAPDMAIIVDSTHWEERTPEERVAILDRALQTVHVSMESGGEGPIYDNQGRPKLRTRQPDLVIPFFRDIVERHREHAPESRQIEKARQAGAQIAMNFSAPLRAVAGE